jgi:hypothetical protein
MRYPMLPLAAKGVRSRNVDFAKCCSLPEISDALYAFDSVDIIAQICADDIGDGVI